MTDATPFDLAKLRADAAKMRSPCVLARDVETATTIAEGLGPNVRHAKTTLAARGEAYLVDLGHVWEWPAPPPVEEKPFVWMIRHSYGVR